MALELANLLRKCVDFREVAQWLLGFKNQDGGLEHVVPILTPLTMQLPPCSCLKRTLENLKHYALSGMRETLRWLHGYTDKLYAIYGTHVFWRDDP